MKDSKKNELIQEMGISEMKGVSGGIGFLPLPIMPLEVLQKAFDAIMNNKKACLLYTSPSPRDCS